VEREGQVLATDALQRCLAFVDALEDRSMTSTASRLSTVQREIAELDARLSPNQSTRAALIKRRIAALQLELDAVNRGEFEVLDGRDAFEGIREVYQLAVSLRADFRRVEESYRAADLALRQKIIGDKGHRGEVMDELLDGHDALISTPEGQVFEGFHRQLVQTADLEQMKGRLRNILDNANTDMALDRRQKRDLRGLVPHLVSESERVIQARAQSERDVRGFIKAGMFDEHHRVGAILQALFEVALDVDWGRQSVRRGPAQLPPVGVVAGTVPAIERLLARDLPGEAGDELDFSVQAVELADLDEEFWQAYDALDRTALFNSTMTVLSQRVDPMTLAGLASALPPTHPLETLSYWLAMARQGGVVVTGSDEVIDLYDEVQGWNRFRAPYVQISHETVQGLSPEELE
jgi:hypothetical protein